MENAVTGLQELGFSEYEARTYVALLQRHPLNGYELAKASGLPRANVYSVLQKLEHQGAVVRQDTPSGARYAPIPAEELMQRLRARFHGALDSAQRSLDQVAPATARDYVWNTQGYQVLLEHARTLLDSTQGSLLVALWPQEALALGEHFKEAEERGVEVATLCLAACAEECGGCRGRIYRYAVAPEQDSRWLVLVPDEAEVLAGEVTSGGEALAVRSRQKLMVQLAGWYIRHSIALAAVVNDLGSRLQDLLGREARSALAAMGPGRPSVGWLEHMRELLGRAPTKRD